MDPVLSKINALTQNLRTFRCELQRSLFPKGEGFSEAFETVTPKDSVEKAFRRLEGELLDFRNDVTVFLGFTMKDPIRIKVLQEMKNHDPGVFLNG